MTPAHRHAIEARDVDAWYGIEARAALDLPSPPARHVREGEPKLCVTNAANLRRLPEMRGAAEEALATREVEPLRAVVRRLPAYRAGWPPVTCSSPRNPGR